MSLNRVIADLEKGLDILRAMNSTLPERVIPPQGITLPDAFARLKAAAPDAHSLSIYPPEIQWSKYSRDTLELSHWKVWDGNKHYSGSTLIAAIEKMEDANKPATVEPEEAAAILDSLTVQDEPTAPLPPVDAKLEEPAF